MWKCGLRGRRSKGKGNGISDAREARRAREEGGKETSPLSPPFFVARGLAPKFPSPLISNVCQAGSWKWNGFNFGSLPILTLFICLSVSFDGFWRWIKVYFISRFRQCLIFLTVLSSLFTTLAQAVGKETKQGPDKELMFCYILIWW